jgi:hypothetical protein
MGRPPLAGERARWLGHSRVELIDWALATTECWENWLDEQLFFFLLVDNFRPTSDGVTAIPTLLTEGAIGVGEALHRICLSTSFDRRNPGPDTFVSVVMEQLLGMTVQRAPRELEIGKRVYEGHSGTFLGRPGNTQSDIVHIAISDRRCIENFLEREHSRFLRKAATPKELAAWTDALLEEGQAFRAILGSWLASHAYDERLELDAPQPNRVFARALYVDVFGRVPTATEVQRLRTALDALADSRPLRALVARLMLDSGKASVPRRGEIEDVAAWTILLFERLLGRPPSESELSVFVEGLRSPTCEPSTALYAIVSHPEYQLW